ncbi:MAG: peptide ABC transporter substrate-binding protein, partial [Chloroflexota bacterium]
TQESAAAAVNTAVPTEPAKSQTLAGDKSITVSFVTGDPASLNPIYASTWGEECVFDLIYLPLWNIDDQGGFHMELAVELPTVANGGVSADGKTITIKFNPDANWSDGQPVTAEDAVFTYDMVMADKNTVTSRYPFDTYIESMKAVDTKTLQIQLNSVWVDWPFSIFTGLSRVLPKHILQPVFDKDGSLDNAAYNRLPSVVNGPFTISQFEPGSHISFNANDTYWRGRPKLDKIFYRLAEDRAAQLAALASNQADIGTYIIGSELSDIKKIDGMTTTTSPNGLIQTIFFNVDPKTANPALTDANVRKALVMSIDRQLIIDQLYFGVYKVPVGFWNGTVYDNPDLKPYPFDPAQAKDLLEKAGWVDANGDGIREKDGKDLVLRYVYISGDEVINTMVVTIQQMLADVGVKVDLLPNTQEVLWASYGDNGPLAHGEFDMTHWVDGMAYYPSPDTSYFLCAQMPTADAPDGYNWFGVCDPALDSLFQQQAIEIDPQKRIDEFHQIGTIMHNQAYLVPIRNDDDIYAVSGRLKDIKFSGADPFMFAYEWDIK